MSKRPIAPFGDEARDLFVGAQTIAAWQEAGVRACGLELTDVDEPRAATERPCFLFYDDLFFTEMALRQFIAAALAEKDDVAWAMPDSAAMRAHRVLDDEPPVENGGIRCDACLPRDAAPLESRQAIDTRCRALVQSARELTARIHLPIPDSQ